MKSGVFYNSNVSEDVRSNLNAILGVNNPLNMGKYFGLPSLIGRNKNEIFSYVRDRLWKKLQLWRSKKLSMSGKEILIKVVAQSIPTYVMIMFLLTLTLLDELHRMLNALWWGHGSNLNDIKRESWESLCAPKSSGSMRFRNLHLFNVTLLGKLGWCIIMTLDSWVSRILKAKYFLDSILGVNPSFTWRSIHEANNLICQGTRWKIRDGEQVRIWGDPWINRDNNFFIDIPCVNSFEDMVVSNLFIPRT
ncbi:hypothetical protein ACS0TY_034735 [Phlomoides rotata]